MKNVIEYEINYRKYKINEPNLDFENGYAIFYDEIILDINDGLGNVYTDLVYVKGVVDTDLNIVINPQYNYDYIEILDDKSILVCESYNTVEKGYMEHFRYLYRKYDDRFVMVNCDLDMANKLLMFKYKEKEYNRGR